MANAPSRSEAGKGLTRKHAFVCVPPEGVPVEDIVLAVRKIIGDENIHSASRVNQKVFVFVSDVSLVHEVVSTGITTESGHFIMASPLITPMTRVVISNAPPFISHDKILSILSHYGKMVSRMSTIPLGYRNECVRHVMSFRRQVYMVLPDRGEDTRLNISFKINFEDTHYQIFASAATLTLWSPQNVLGEQKKSTPGALEG